MNKIVIIINGKGGSGKDTICNIVSKYYKTINISSIDIIKDMAKVIGYKDGKSLCERKLLSDLKRVVKEYNNAPLHSILEKYSNFYYNDNENEIMFIHIREPEEIQAFRKKVTTPVYTLLIRSNRTEYSYGNTSDDNVENYDYDFIYNNNGPKENLEKNFMNFFNKRILQNE